MHYDEHTVTLHEDQCAFVMSRRVLLRMRNVSDKSCRENQNTHFMFNDVFFSPENRAVYEIMWKNTMGARQATDDNKMMRRRDEFCMPVMTQARIETRTKSNTYCSSTTTMVARTHLSVAWYVHCVSCYCSQLWAYCGMLLAVIGVLLHFVA